jgi:hypothetical protein
MLKPEGCDIYFAGETVVHGTENLIRPQYLEYGIANLPWIPAFYEHVTGASNLEPYSRRGPFF